ncbi:MAG: class I SAM-dependent methyltransferase [Promethearchaeota archaeon]
MTSVKNWIEKEGENILREIGIKKGQKILDFGCGTGVYAVLASRIIGNSGIVYALDSDEEGLLKELINKINKENIKNIKIIKTSGEIKIPLADNSIDVVLIYDILHLLNHNEREELFREAYRILKKGAFVSYHATHLRSRYGVNLEEIQTKMKNYGFILTREFKKPMFHWSWIEDSNILNYKKN